MRRRKRLARSEVPDSLDRVAEGLGRIAAIVWGLHNQEVPSVEEDPSRKGEEEALG